MKYSLYIKRFSMIFIIFSVCIFITNHLSAQGYSFKPGPISNFTMWNISNPSDNDNLYYSIQVTNEIFPNIMDQGYKDNFEDGVADNWHDDQSGTWAAVNGVYRMSGTSANKMRWSLYIAPDDEVFENFEYRIDITRKQGSTNVAQGIWFRWSGNGKYELLIAAVGMFKLSKYSADLENELIPWTDSEYLNKGIGQKNTIKVVCSNGSHIILYANDKPLMKEEYIDPSPLPGGTVGITAGDEYDETSGVDPIVDFDNFVLNVFTSATP